MKITFDNETKDALLENLSKQGKSVVRLAIAGFGWGGPNLSVVLDEQKSNDNVETVNGITFAVDKDEEYIFEDCIVSYKKTFFGKTFRVISKAIGESSCS